MSRVRGLGTHARALRACLAILMASVAARGAPGVGRAESVPRGDPRQEPRAPAGLGDAGLLGAALKAEIDRGMAKLRLPGLPGPYFVSGIISDTDVFQVAASLGAIQQTDRSRQRQLQVEVRVGDYDFDDSNFMDDRSVQEVSELPIEDGALAVRRAAWLLIDGAFKDAAARFETKRSVRQRQAETSERAASFARIEPVQLVGAPPEQLGPE